MRLARAAVKQTCRPRWKEPVVLLGLLTLASPEAQADQTLDQAIQLANGGSYKQALLLLHGSLKQHSQRRGDAARNYYYQGLCYQKLGHPVEAQRCFGFSQTLQSTKPAGGSSTNNERRGDANSTSVFKGSENPSKNSALENLGNVPSESKIRFNVGEQGHMMVDAFINGRPIQIMFDTGAPGVLLSVGHLAQLGLAKPAESPTTSVRGWAGKPVPAWERDLNVKMGEITRRLRCTIMDSEREDPLVGYAFVEGLPYEIDQKGRCMIVHNPASVQQPRAVNALYDIPCKIVHTKPVVPVRVSNKTTEFFIDTGASSTIMNYSTFLKLGMELPPDAKTVYGGGVGGAVTFKEVEMDLTFGPIHKSSFTVNVGGSAGNAIGQDFLEGWKFTVDDKNEMVRFFH